ncbi:hypothetical protein [Thermosulfurimonas dismutans]|uniref:Glucosamine-1-phosphate N-acetyltransferase n=1 Tax=Thermosulfurimonas dismutans TaxID=999894 RepID=A0A179D6J0_9BACT|nr:hypothetical protein [Thermosulfurimonas dismutans]OAQ21720.1 Glucosamine-1-phosphate N-acetyltransferase [Thermosulfurimonas dismutans]
MNLAPEDFFDFRSLSRHGVLFDGLSFVWEALARLKDYLKDHVKPLPIEVPVGEPLQEGLVLYRDVVLPFKAVTWHLQKKGPVVEYGGERLPGASLIFPGAVLFDREIEIEEGVIIEPGALIKGPAILGPGTEVRQGAYIRGNLLCGQGCVIGHTTEVKNAILLDGAKAGHFAYIGDSILGKEVNLGAGTKLANLKLTGTTVKIRHKGQVLDTGLRKLGAILGDEVQTGCNSVTNPGTLIGPGSYVLPNTTAGPGVIPGKKIIR